VKPLDEDPMENALSPFELSLAKAQTGKLDAHMPLKDAVVKGLQKLNAMMGLPADEVIASPALHT
jgi:hypothetical protein